VAAKRSKKATRYSAKKQRDALELYVQFGPREASRQSGIPARTISRWAAKAGVATEVLSETAKATEAATAKAELTRAWIRATLLEKVADILGRLDMPHIDFRGKDAVQVTFPGPTPTGVKEYALAIGILLDKYRLEMGESTDRRQFEHSGDITLRQVPDDELKSVVGRLVAKLGIEV
jgi:hypothetical protein